MKRVIDIVKLYSLPLGVIGRGMFVGALHPSVGEYQKKCCGLMLLATFCGIGSYAFMKTQYTPHDANVLYGIGVLMFLGCGAVFLYSFGGIISTSTRIYGSKIIEKITQSQYL